MTGIDVNIDKKPTRVAIVPCNGEGLCEGTVPRFACRMVLEELRPGQTITMCLPLFVVGDEKQRTFTHRIATITLDGCERRCYATTAAKLGGRPIYPLVVSEILAQQGAKFSGNCQTLTENDRRFIGLIAEKVAAQVDQIAIQDS